jgi:cystathionine beta-lyase/cystathionine gamma-synthase
MSKPSALGPCEPLVPPLYQSSVYTLPDLDALDRVMNGEEQGYIYARDAHPNGKHLASRLAELHHASWALIGASGMASISTIVLSMVQQGQRIVASNRLYGRTTQLLEQELTRFGVQTAVVDGNDHDAVRTALQVPTRLLFVETMSNPLLRVVDIPALAELAHQHDCRLIIDNTFATPVLTKPLDLGADVVMESLTKMIGGHSDITLGMIAGKEDLLQQVTATCSIWGFSANPFDCWLADRGLSTLPLRMHAACANAAALADWLAKQPGVSQVVYPGRSDHPDHALAKRMLQGGYGNMLCFELADGRDAVNRFMRQAPGVPFSPSLGNITTTLSHPWTTSHRYTSPALKKRQGITEGLVRLSVGVEELGAIRNEMAKGLSGDNR